MDDWGGSYGHRVRKIETSFGAWWQVSWTVDRHYPDSRLRFPRTYRRDTDEAGVRRFCKKWGIAIPENLQEAK